MSTNLFSLKNKNVLITGSCRGIGLDLARGLGEAGATVVVCGRDNRKVAKTAAELAELGISTHESTMDVTVEAEVKEAMREIEARLGGLDILVNNAGIQLREKLEMLELRDWHTVIETNLTGAFLVAKAAAPGMITRRRGKIINICSLMSEVGRETTGPYTAAKGGLKMLTKAMAVEWARHNIQVNGIGPGYFLTEMTRPLADDPAFDGWLKMRTPARRWGETRELIGTAIFLASEASSFINGQVIYVDGGVLAAL